MSTESLQKRMVFGKGPKRARRYKGKLEQGPAPIAHTARKGRNLRVGKRRYG